MSFRTGQYWTSALNYTERGEAGLEVRYASSGAFSELRLSTVRLRAAALSASNTVVRCEPDTGLLERHLATCYVSTFDV